MSTLYCKYYTAMGHPESHWYWTLPKEQQMSELLSRTKNSLAIHSNFSFTREMYFSVILLN